MQVVHKTLSICHQGVTKRRQVKSCLKVVSKLPQSCLKVFPKLSYSCPEVVLQLSQSCMTAEAVFEHVTGRNLGRSCLKVVSNMSQSCLKARVAEVVRGHGGPPPKSSDSDKNLKHKHTLFRRELRFVAIYALFGDIWAKKVPF